MVDLTYNSGSPGKVNSWTQMSNKTIFEEMTSSIIQQPITQSQTSTKNMGVNGE